MLSTGMLGKWFEVGVTEGKLDQMEKAHGRSLRRTKEMTRRER
jgi:hypothetical protein